MRTWHRERTLGDDRAPIAGATAAPPIDAAVTDPPPPPAGEGFDLVGDLLDAALSGADHATLARRAVAGVRSVVGADLCEVLRCVGGELESVAGIGLGGLVLEHRIGSIADDPVVAAVVAGRHGVVHHGDGPPIPVAEAEGPDGSGLIRSEMSTAAVPVGDPPDEGVLLVRCIGANRLAAHTPETLHTVASVLTLAQRRRGAERDASLRARRDSLTGLANREIFRRRLASAIAADHRNGNLRIGVAIVDLDNFALVNDGLGHEVGDQVLRAVAERLQAAMRPGDLLARFGGDEFVIAARGLRGAADATRLGERLLGALRAPFTVDGRDLTVRASVGTAITDAVTDTGTDTTGTGTGPSGRTASAEPVADRLVREADAALGLAKDRGRERVESFDPAIAAAVSNRLRTEREVRAALAGDEFEIWYQPIVDVGTGRTVTVEALVRWEHPTRGLVTPADFLPVSETTGLIEDIGRWVIGAVADHLCAWAADSAVIPVAVNLSPRQLLDERLIPVLAATLDRLADAGLDSGALRVEVNERALSPARADNRRAVATTIEAIAALGIAVTVDDFGAGTGLLSHLRDLRVDAVKIDRALVAPMATSGTDYAIVSALVSIARALGTRVIAAGVETDEQFALLVDLGCDLAQGHLFSPPVPGLRQGVAVPGRHT